MSDSKKDRLRAHVADVLSRKGDSFPFEDDESLFLSGRLDSFAVVEVIAFLEGEFGADFTGRVFEEEDFDSIDAMLTLVEA